MLASFTPCLAFEYSSFNGWARPATSRATPLYSVSLPDFTQASIIGVSGSFTHNRAACSVRTMNSYSPDSGATIDPAKMPAKSDTAGGIPWLARLIPKTRGKLRGELPTSLMYGCAGDRAFFREHDISPSEFLAQVFRHEQDDAAVVVDLAPCDDAPAPDEGVGGARNAALGHQRGEAAQEEDFDAINILHENTLDSIFGIDEFYGKS